MVITPEQIAQTADLLLDAAQAFEAAARRLKADAREVRAGRYLADFACASGANAFYNLTPKREALEALRDEIYEAERKAATR